MGTVDDQVRGLVVHSLAEAYLYLMVTPCGECGGGLSPLEHRVHHDAEARVLQVPVVCQGCSAESLVAFDTRRVDPGSALGGNTGELLTGQEPEEGGAEQGALPTRQWHTGSEGVAEVNPFDEPSEVIDVAGWLTLYHVIHEAGQEKMDGAKTTEARRVARQMLLQAGQCLDEALKFYDEDNDLPPPDAFFRAHSRQQFQAKPERFTRQRLVELRGSLPTLGK